MHDWIHHIWSFVVRWFDDKCKAFKGGLISEKFSHWLQSPKKCANHYPEHVLFRWIELRTHHLGIIYYVNFLGRLGSNGFQLKRSFGTHGN